MSRNNNKRDSKHLSVTRQCSVKSSSDATNFPAVDSPRSVNGDSKPEVQQIQNKQHVQPQPKDSGDVTMQNGGPEVNGRCDDVMEPSVTSEMNVSLEMEDYSDVRYDLKSLAVTTHLQTVPAQDLYIHEFYCACMYVCV